MAPPEGIEIGSTKRPWRVGHLVGEGACASVHELIPPPNVKPEFQMVIKLCRLPPQRQNKKKKKSEQEINADLVYYENLMYRTKFNHLIGNVVARIPSAGNPPFYGESQGYRFLVMERMEGTLLEIAPSMLSAGRSKKINVGPVASQLVECVEEIHKCHHLFVDVKPENIMVVPSPSNKKLQDRVRLIDLAMCKPTMDPMTGQHRTNTESQLAGTPLYSSLNVHEGQSHSRRDDLEAVGYVILELLLCVLEPNKSNHLPWSTARSEEEIFELKKKEMDNRQSSLFTKLGGEAAETMWKYFDIVRKLSFKSKPDYELLREILLRGLSVGAPVKKPAAKARKTKATTQLTSPKKIVIELDSDAEDYEVVTSVRKKRRSPRNAIEASSQAKARRLKYEEDPDVQSSEEDASVTCQDKPEDMDWEAIDENPPVDENRVPTKGAVRLVCIEGTMEGKSFDLYQHLDEIVVGSKGGAVVKADGVAPSHTKLVLQSINFVSVDVVDLKSSEGTLVNNTKLRKGGKTRAFANDVIGIGSTKWKVQRLSGGETAASAKPKSKSTPAKKATRKKGATPQQTKNGPGVRLVITEGPNEGESFFLEQNSRNIVVLGRNPKFPDKKACHAIPLDKCADESHAKLELTVHNSVISVKVTDLKSASGTFVNGKKVSTRQAFINDTIKLGDTVMALKGL